MRLIFAVVEHIQYGCKAIENKNSPGTGFGTVQKPSCVRVKFDGGFQIVQSGHSEALIPNVTVHQ